MMVLMKKNTYLIKKNAIKIIKISDYFTPKKTLKIISCRLYNQKISNFVSYFYSSVICKNNNLSVLHSSSFGNTLFCEQVEAHPERIFDKDTLSKAELILLTLYNYSKRSTNTYKITFKTVNKENSMSFVIKCKGDTCRVILKKYIDQLSTQDHYQIIIKGPVSANPYLLINFETVFHI